MGEAPIVREKALSFCVFIHSMASMVDFSGCACQGAHSLAQVTTGI